MMWRLCFPDVVRRLFRLPPKVGYWTMACRS
jgi:hypothetical protein